MRRLLPLLFVFLWSTGFVGAKYGLPHAAPLSFLLTRYGFVIGLMALIALASRAPWPAGPRAWLHIGVTGILVHGLYLGGVFEAIKHGLPAGVTALVVGMQPLLTAALAGVLLGERVQLRQWGGLALGFVGVALVVSGRIGDGGAVLDGALLPALLALVGITAGTLYQKRYCPGFDLRTGSVVQFLCAALVTAPWVAAEGYQVTWNGDFVFALAWLVLVLSIGAISLLNVLIRSGSAVNVASLFYLTPPTTAVIAWAMFGETLSPVALAGMALAVGGVYLVGKKA